MLTGSPAVSKIDPQSVGFFGFSRGGLTGLALAGADADWESAKARELCQQSSQPMRQPAIRRPLSQKDAQESQRCCTVLLHGDMNCSTLRRNNALDFMVDLIDRIV
jgi:predicted dienelactone hydrolase